MPRAFRDSITIADADGSNEREYTLLVDRYGTIQWFEEGASDDTMPPGEPVSKKSRYWGGGMGETQEMGRGGYFYSENAYHGDPFALKPRPTVNQVVLTDNATPVERFFEAEDAGGNGYLYALAGLEIFKIKQSDQTLKETKTFTGIPTVFAHGSYVGDGNASQAITGLAFQPAVVIVKHAGTQFGVIKTADMAGNNSKLFTTSALITTGIKTLDATPGFTVGNHASVNTSGQTYYWEAWKAEAGVVATGTYTGDGVDDRQITGVGFRPAFVILLAADAEHPWMRSNTHDAGWAAPIGLGGGAVNYIQDFHGDGFEVGTANSVNANGVTYYWFAMPLLAGQLVTGTYAGNGQDSRPITGLGLQPLYLLLAGILSAVGTPHVHRSATIAGDSAQSFKNTANAANLIESLDSDGFTVGSAEYANQNGAVFHYIAFAAGGGTPQVGKPAKWVTLWRVPLGDSLDAQTLTTVHDEGGAGDDTWTINYGLAARHFERCGNKLARATKRHVSLCSADDITNLANWGADYGGVAPYAIGSPDVEITDLVEWADELAVCATDGMYMFDGVALSRQQLPLLHGLTDDDNGKNTLRMASFIFYPSADGYWRWRYGAHKRVDPDADRFYVPAKETSNEPLNLKHYGSDFCGDHVYHACYDGTNYLLMHGKLSEEGDLLWDCLLSTGSAIRAVYVDSDRRLWFGLGNNLLWIQLSQGGEPDGGTFGQQNLVTTIYLDQKILADDIDVRLRMIKVICRNSDAEYKWEIYASRDGAAFAKVGGDITADGETKLYWDPTANLTARRLRLKVVGTATGSFTPTATPPEIIGIEFFGETVPDDARIIRAMLDLEGERAGQNIYEEVLALKNAGVKRVRHPLTGVELNMIIFDHAGANVRQKGYEEATAGITVYMRHGDTS